jgi:hypothetical protein
MTLDLRLALVTWSLGAETGEMTVLSATAE